MTGVVGVSVGIGGGIGVGVEHVEHSVTTDEYTGMVRVHGQLVMVSVVASVTV